MKKFSFSLQKILDLRNFELDQAQMELGKVNAQIANVNNQLKTVAIISLMPREMLMQPMIFHFMYRHRIFSFILTRRKTPCLVNWLNLK